MTVDLKGEDMYHFLGKLITVVLPRIKDWRGVRATTGDSSGNLSFGLEPDTVALFPEIEVNYDAYPPKMIPVCFSYRGHGIGRKVLTRFVGAVYHYSYQCEL